MSSMYERAAKEIIASLDFHPYAENYAVMEGRVAAILARHFPVPAPGDVDEWPDNLKIREFPNGR